TPAIRSRLAAGSLRFSGAMLTSSISGIVTSRSRICRPVVPASPSMKTLGISIFPIAKAYGEPKPIALVGAVHHDTFAVCSVQARGLRAAWRPAAGAPLPDTPVPREKPHEDPRVP